MACPVYLRLFLIYELFCFCIIFSYNLMTKKQLSNYRRCTDHRVRPYKIDSAKFDLFLLGEWRTLTFFVELMMMQR